jgi:hypothetical protein
MVIKAPAVSLLHLGADSIGVGLPVRTLHEFQLITGQPPIPDLIVAPESRPSLQYFSDAILLPHSQGCGGQLWSESEDCKDVCLNLQ